MGWHGQFCWYEMMASDQGAAQAFYTDVIGWTCEPSGMPGMDYRLFLANGDRVAGLMPTVPGGPPPCWTGYVAVDDCDATAAKVKELGGTLFRAPDDIPGIGRFAVFADPQGAMLAILQPVTPDDPPPPPQPNAPGRCGWQELHTSDAEAAWPFYEALFGWTKTEAMPTPDGPYQMWERGGDAGTRGGMMKNPHAPHPFWAFYFTVPALDTAVAKVKAAGGSTMFDAIEVPTGQWVSLAMDPWQAPFALVAEKR